MDFKEVLDFIKGDLDTVTDGFREIVDSKKDFPEMQKMLSMVLLGGKMVRPTLVFLCGRLFNGDIELLKKMALSAETMHIATLVHDDAIDSADLRRGHPTINSVYGVDLAILLGDYLFSRAGHFVADTDNMRAMKLFTKTLGIISRGEIKQAVSSYVLNQKYDQYIERMAGKTSALFQMSTQSGAILANAPEAAIQALDRFGYNLGLAFQIVDDILDYTGNSKDVGKPVGADLREGTLTLPAAKLMKMYPGDNPVIEVFNHRNVEENIKKTIEMIKQTNIIEECYEEAEKYYKLACDDLAGLPDNQYRDCLYALAGYVIERHS